MPAPSRPSRTRLARAAVGSAGFLLLAPGVVAGLVPWSLTDWRLHDMWLPGRAAGVVLIAGGVGTLLHAVARFVIEGIGTPAPGAPTEVLVVGGLYRYVRNPMYLAVGATILGQALLLGQPVLVVYACAFAVAVTVFVYGYEEPALARRFGDQYDAYRSAVPRWLPQPHAWRRIPRDRKRQSPTAYRVTVERRGVAPLDAQLVVHADSERAAGELASWIAERKRGGMFEATKVRPAPRDDVRDYDDPEL